MKRSLSFTDGYGLALIASKLPGVDPSEIIRHLDPEAKRIGLAIINTKSASKKAKSSTKDAFKSGKKVKSVALRA
jgi:hypothetical protein